jgi:hypothetical protein
MSKRVSVFGYAWRGFRLLSPVSMISILPCAFTSLIVASEADRTPSEEAGAFRRSHRNDLFPSIDERAGPSRNRPPVLLLRSFSYLPTIPSAGGVARCRGAWSGSRDRGRSKVAEPLRLATFSYGGQVGQLGRGSHTQEPLVQMQVPFTEQPT